MDGFEWKFPNQQNVHWNTLSSKAQAQGQTLKPPTPRLNERGTAASREARPVQVFNGRGVNRANLRGWDRGWLAVSSFWGQKI